MANDSRSGCVHRGQMRGVHALLAAERDDLQRTPVHGPFLNGLSFASRFSCLADFLLLALPETLEWNWNSLLACFWLWFIIPIY